MGISTLCAMDALHCMLFNGDYKILVIATKQDVARNLVEKVQLMHEFLPNFLKGKIVNDNKLSLVFANGSSIKAVSSSPDAGRSEALSKLIIDECLSGETKITIKNTETHTIEDIRIDQLFQQSNGKKYQILSPSGWSNFSGVKKSVTDVLFTVTFSDGSSIKCTENHQLKYPTGDFLEVCQICVGDQLEGGKIVKSVSYEVGEFEVYDAINVQLGNEYITNGVVSHNCAHIDCMEEIWTSAQLTLATGGKAILLSSPCVVGDSKITIKNKITGEIKKVNIEDLYNNPHYQ